MWLSAESVFTQRGIILVLIKRSTNIVRETIGCQMSSIQNNKIKMKCCHSHFFAQKHVVHAFLSAFDEHTYNKGFSWASCSVWSLFLPCIVKNDILHLHPLSPFFSSYQACSIQGASGQSAGPGGWERRGWKKDRRLASAYIQ